MIVRILSLLYRVSFYAHCMFVSKKQKKSYKKLRNIAKFFRMIKVQWLLEFYPYCTVSFYAHCMFVSKKTKKKLQKITNYCQIISVDKSWVIDRILSLLYSFFLLPLYVCFICQFLKLKQKKVTKNYEILSNYFGW